MEEVESIIMDVLATKVSPRPTLSDDLASLSIDSLAMAELALEIEQRLKIRLDEGVLEQRTVAELVEYVRKLIDKKKRSPAK